jgi:glycosyltransferase involved in cell wall biosynthesis
VRPGVTAVIPAIPPRVADGKLHRAVSSVLGQTRPVDAVSVSIDTGRLGSSVNRNQALAGVQTEWTALLDDDDEWSPSHIELLMDHARDTDADLVYPWFDVPGGFDPWPHREGRPFDREALRSENYIPITVLVRTELLRDVGGFRPKGPPDNPCDDWGTWDALLERDAKFTHLNRRTWTWHWHGANTSGRRDLW